MTIVQSAVRFTDTLPAAHGPGLDFTMAFQPIIDLWRREVISYEALVRGRAGEGAGHVLGRLTDATRYAFDQACRVKAIQLAHHLGATCALNINFLPNALLQSENCLLATARAARLHGFPADRIVFEMAEGERATDLARVADVIRECRRQGFRIAIDDFGAGHSGLNLLADLHPDFIKLDLGLCRGIEASPSRRSIVRGVMSACWDMGIGVVAEGVETPAELSALRDLGVRYYQGFLFARPAVEDLPAVAWPNGVN